MNRLFFGSIFFIRDKNSQVQNKNLGKTMLAPEGGYYLGEELERLGGGVSTWGEELAPGGGVSKRLVRSVRRVCAL
jgi:hypothetical protein